MLLSRADDDSLEDAPGSSINRLIEDAVRDPAAGIGKPEPLRDMLAGVCSRRITDELSIAKLRSLLVAR